MNAREEFRAAIMAAGLTAPEHIVADGKVHRFASNGNPRSDAGWYWMHDDERPLGKFGCWKHGIEVEWSAREQRPFTSEERAAWKAKMQESERLRAEAIQVERESAAAMAADMWARATTPYAHPYLAAKSVAAYGIRVLNGELLVPMRAGPGAYVGLQRIAHDGEKKFLKGTPAGGAYHVIGKPAPAGRLVIAEGYATAASIHLATGLCVVVAFNAGNLEPVARKIRAAMPGASIVIAADDDRWTEGNPGMKAAASAAAAVRGTVAVPVWSNARATKKTDFNDLHADEGLDAVRACFETPSPVGRDDAESVSGARAPNNPASTEAGADSSPVDSAVDVPPAREAVPPAGRGDSDVSLPAIVDQGIAVSGAAAIAKYDLDTNSDGIPYASTSNIIRILAQDADFRGRIWYDEFLGKIMTVWRSADGAVRQWSDVDDINLQICLQAALMMPRLAKQVVQDAVVAAAHQDTRNECQAYLIGLEWDGVERLPQFMVDCFGTDDTAYTQAAGENFWISMVARVMRPGCKVDTMIVLEGAQGAGKSQALGIIGGPWFAEAHQSPSDKDFYMNLSGKMIVEIGEMDAFNRAEVTKVKQVITCQVDTYRAPYARHSADHPRRCVFAGTTNRDDWNKDETGARRFWPVLVHDVRHDVIRENRDQYFAEALHKLNSGANWWTMPVDETLAQQEARRDADVWEPKIAEWLIGRSETTVAEIMDELLRLPIDRQDRGNQQRIGRVLRAIGWHRPMNALMRGGKRIRLWLRQEHENGQGSHESPV